MFPEDIGRAKRIDDGGIDIERVKSSFPNQMRLDGLKVVMIALMELGIKQRQKFYGNSAQKSYPLVFHRTVEILI